MSLSFMFNRTMPLINLLFFYVEGSFIPITVNFVIDLRQLISTITVLDRFPRNFKMSGFSCAYSCSLMLVDMLIHVLQHETVLFFWRNEFIEVMAAFPLCS